jgi:tRNA A-37 threonylcarbamoyl transferase component Bud32
VAKSRYTPRAASRASARPVAKAAPRARASSRASSRRHPSSSKVPQFSRNRNKGMTKSTTVGQYVVSKSIGQGTFGKVKLGIHTMTSEKVAIKVLQKSKIKEAADVERVSREIAILKKVNHDQVVRLFEVIDTPQAIYLIMEFCEGGELFDYIVKHTRIKETVAVKFFHQIIDGIDYLHKTHVIHRDLKPENLLMQRRPEGWHIKVVDFGLSNTDEGNRLLKTACGSPCYAAPEMIAGKKYKGPLADLWSVGVILFAMVCGYLPFEDNNTSQLYKKILRGAYKAPKFISPQVNDLIARILNTDPNHRYTVADIRRHPWMLQSAAANVRANKRAAKASAPAAEAAGGAAPASKPKKVAVVSGAVGATVTGRRGEAATADGRRARDDALASIDETVLRQMADLGFNAAQVIDSLATGKHNQITTAYQLLVTRKKKIAAAKKKLQEETLAKERAAAAEKARKLKELQDAQKANLKVVVKPTKPLPAEARSAKSSAVRTPTNPVKAAPPQRPKAGPAAGSPNRVNSNSISGGAPGSNPAGRGGRRIVGAAPKQTGGVRPAPPTSKPPAKDSKAKSVATAVTGTLKPIAAGFGAAPSPKAAEKGARPSPPPARPPRVDAGAAKQDKVSAPSSTGPQGKAYPTGTSTSPDREANLKTFHGVFDPLHTSTKDPTDIFGDMKRVLALNRIPFAATGAYAITCQSNDCRWKLEVCKLEDVKKVYVVRRQRLAGETYAYEVMSKRVMEQLRL